MLAPPTTATPRGPIGAKLQLPITLLLIGALAVTLSFATLGFGLLSFSAIRYRANKPHVALVQPVMTVPAPITSVDDLAGIEKQARDAQVRAEQLDKSDRQTHAQIESLQQEEAQLAQTIAQRQSALRDAQEDIQRLRDEQQRIQALRAEAVDLERRIATLRARIEVARETANIGRAAQPTTPQIVECVRGGIVLKPQQTQIAISAMRNGVLVSLARERGVYFLVRPTGFESFIEARNIARGAGKVIGYEPMQQGAEDQ